jgi:hypothetical protein
MNNKKINLLKEKLEKLSGKEVIFQELFGLSKKEQEDKVKTVLKKEALSEINNFDFNNLFYKPKEGDFDYQSYLKSLKSLIFKSKSSLASLSDLLPELFDISNPGAVQVKSSDNKKGVIPSAWYKYITFNKTIDNDIAKESLKSKLKKI